MRDMKKETRLYQAGNMIGFGAASVAEVPSVTDYVLEQPAKCPNCRREIMEKTLIEPV